MIINHDLKLLFIHIPKTGGGSIKTSLLSHGKCTSLGYHRPINQAIHDQYKDYFKFAVVRNSWDAIESWYRYFVIRKGLTIDFTEYLKNHLALRKGPFPHQLKYIGGKSNILVNKIIRFENLRKDFRDLQDRYGLSPLNQSHKTKKGKSYYTQDTVEFVYDLCRDDIEYFNFKIPKEIASCL